MNVSLQAKSRDALRGIGPMLSAAKANVAACQTSLELAARERDALTAEIGTLEKSVGSDDAAGIKRLAELRERQGLKGRDVERLKSALEAAESDFTVRAWNRTNEILAQEISSIRAELIQVLLPKVTAFFPDDAAAKEVVEHLPMIKFLHKAAGWARHAPFSEGAMQRRVADVETLLRGELPWPRSQLPRPAIL